MIHQISSRIASNLSALMGAVALRLFQTTKVNNAVAMMVDVTIHTCSDRPTTSSMLIDLRAKNPRSTQWFVIGITNKAKRQKFAYRIVLTKAWEQIAGCAVSISTTGEYSSCSECRGPSFAVIRSMTLIDLF